MSSRSNRIPRHKMTDTKLDCGFGYEDPDPPRWDPEVAGRAFRVADVAMERRTAVAEQIAATTSGAAPHRVDISEGQGRPTYVYPENYVKYLGQEASKAMRIVDFHGGAAAVAAYAESVKEAVRAVNPTTASEGR